jgi:hypothetical protein
MLFARVRTRPRFGGKSLKTADTRLWSALPLLAAIFEAPLRKLRESWAPRLGSHDLDPLLPPAVRFGALVEIGHYVVARGSNACILAGKDEGVAAHPHGRVRPCGAAGERDQGRN